MSHTIPVELMLKKEMELYEDDDWADTELEDSTYNPANDEFKRTVVSLQRKIQQLSTQLRPRHVMAVRLSLTEHRNKDIAARLKLTPASVSNIIRSEKAQQLKRAIIQLRNLLDGVSALEREQMLWRIALQNEEFNPRTAIAAVSEINNMKVDHAAAKEKSKVNQSLAQQPQVIIQLSDSRLVPTKLDV